MGSGFLPQISFKRLILEYRLLKRYFYTALNFLLASFTVPLFLSSLNPQTTMKLIERRAV